MKNKTEITRKQLGEIGNLIDAANKIIGNAYNTGSIGPSEESEFATKYQGEYWWDDWLELFKASSSAGSVFSRLNERINEDENDN